MSHRGGHKKKRARDNGAWGAYYSNRNRNKRDRYAELDASASRPINVGPQPTLARNRRQLADEQKWGEHSQKGEEIFQDLITSHIENKSFSNNDKNRLKAQPMIINSRKSFWKRKLSVLSTKDFDVAWKEGRNKFLKHINNQGTGQASSSAVAAGGAAASVDAEPKDRQGLKDPQTAVSQKSKKNVDGAKPKAGKSKSSNKNEIQGTKPTANGKTSTKPTGTSEVMRSSAPDLEVIDLCDSDSDNDDTNEIPATAHKSKLGIPKEKEKSGEVQNHKQFATKKEADVSETITSVPRESRAAANSAPAPAPAPPVTKPNTSSTKELSDSTKNAKITEETYTNRWSKFFLGPNFRTDYIFSLDNEDDR